MTSPAQSLVSRAKAIDLPDPQSRPVIVTGAGGFIGRALVARLAARGTSVVAVVRRPAAMPQGVAVHAVGDITAALDWAPLLAGAGAVVHLASRAHAPKTAAEDGSMASDAAAAAQLMRAAGRAGIERVVLMSSIKVLGDRTGDVPFRAGRPPSPDDAYGFAKWSIEEAMRGAAGETALTIIRPPLVYGLGVKGNFLALIRLVDSGMALPLASVHNRRSLVGLDNLVDLVETALRHPAARYGTFLVRDDEEVSTPELVRRIAMALGRAPRLFPTPPAALRVVARMLGRADAAERLLGSLRVDDSATRERLGWRPRVPLDEGLAASCAWFRAERGAAAPARAHG